MDFKELIKQGTVLLDGAMGTMLQNAGLEAGAAPELLNIDKPELIEDIHRKSTLSLFFILGIQD